MRLHLTGSQAVVRELLPALGAENALLTAGTADRCNTMTIGWCQAGRLWGLQTCTVYVRPERYTYSFMEEQEYFTVSVLPKNMQNVMALCGTKSGRDMDKIKECGLTVRTGAGGAPFFEEAELVLVCRTLYAQDLDPACVLPAVEEKILPSYGAKGGWHRIYTGEIVEAYSAL
ncbi:MAG: flavin reductase family protein [Oscillibacter sp.]|jgi:flavin reductase (DIM6/NTAB) family NADH-FMN oxidoreductase RutF|nr:flavin reductase family protein [Oscillibacter sp.]